LSTNWTNEEGSMVRPSDVIGVFAGLHTQDWAYARVDADGSDVWQRASVSAGKATRLSARAKCTRSLNCTLNKGRF
jgi:hypothetical protein